MDKDIHVYEKVTKISEHLHLKVDMNRQAYNLDNLEGV